MFKQGPVPAFVHGLLEYVAGALLIAAPKLLDEALFKTAEVFFG